MWQLRTDQFENIFSKLTTRLHRKGITNIIASCPARFDDQQQIAARNLVRSCAYQSEHGCKTRCCGQGGVVEASVTGTVKHEAQAIADEAAGRSMWGML